MTVIDPAPAKTPLKLVAHDLYRDIHKAIRAELFAVTAEAGRLDPSDDGRLALTTHLRTIADLLVAHARHEDSGVQPAIEEHLPALADRIIREHEAIETRLDTLLDLADAAAGRGDTHRLYVELASFTATYLEHQDIEERLVMPALESAIGVEAVVAIHEAITGSIPPEEMLQLLAVMLPTMNVDDRTDLLGGINATAPADAVEGIWSLAQSVLAPAEHAAVAARLGRP